MTHISQQIETSLSARYKRASFMRTMYFRPSKYGVNLPFKSSGERPARNSSMGGLRSDAVSIDEEALWGFIVQRTVRALMGVRPHNSQQSSD